MKTNFKSVDDYWNAQPEETLLSLVNLQQTINDFVADSEWYISYQIPTVRYQGKPLLAIAGYQHHCSLYVMSKAIVSLLEKELAGFDYSGTTIRFQPTQSLPKNLIEKIIALRKEEIALVLEAKRSRKKGSSEK
ncbi:MAG: hypothetical protein C0512_10520 [Flavobacterium sp.]|nr:hypothetical protein [Flavobacterium sp.]